MEDAILRRTWAEIDLDALEHNYKVARTRIGDGVKYLGVVKADAYGHGAIQVSRKLEQLPPVWTRAGNCATAALLCQF